MSERSESANATDWAVGDDRTARQCTRALVDVVDDGVFRLDADDRFVAVDETLLSTAGCDREALLGEHVSTLLSTDEAAQLDAARQTHSEAEGKDRADLERRDDADARRGPESVTTLECALRTADGTAVPYRLRLAPVRVDGEFRGSIGVVRERSESDTSSGGAGSDADRERVDSEPDRETARPTETPTEAAATVFEDAAVGVFVFDEATEVAWLNAAAERYFGIDRETVLGRNRESVIDETLGDRVADPAAFRDAVTATDDGAAAERSECHVTAAGDRAERWLEFRGRPIESGPYAGGRIELYYDVTDQHRRAYQLRRLNEAVREWLASDSREAVAERATEQLVDILGLEINGVFLHDPDARELRPVAWSEPAAAAIGEIPTFAEGEGIAWRVFDSGRAEIDDDVTADPDVYNPETPIRSEICLPIGDHGVVIIGSERRDAFDDADLSLAKVVASSLEAIFDRLRHERSLERERAQTEQLFQTAPVAISVRNADGELVRANQRARETLGAADGSPIDAATIGGRDVRDVDETVASDESPAARVRATGEPMFNQEIVLEGPDGERRWFSLNAAPVFDADGALERVVSVGEEITELKVQKQRLQRRKSELETELSEILGRVSDGFYALDDEFRFTHVNETAEELLGRSRAELLGTVLWDVFPEAVGSDLEDRYREALETQQSLSFERRSRPLGIWAQVQVYPSETGLSIYFRDISERKARERELTTYETIVETVEDGIYVLDEDERFTTVNETYAELTGYDREELLGAHASTVVTESAMDRAQTVATDDREIPTIETELETKSGSRVPVEASVATLAATDGRERVGVVRDITDRRERQRKLEASEQRYRTLAENFPNGIVALYDDELRYTAAGGQLVDQLGIDQENAIGQRIHDRYPDDILAEIEPHFRAALAGEERSFEVSYYGRRLSAHTLPVRTAGDVRAGMLVVQDVTERAEYQRKLEESNERLEQFAYAASHDLQEPLRMVTSYLQLIENRYADELDADGREFIDFAVDGAERMREMIEGLLAYSRVETRGDPFEPVDLEETLEAVRRDLELQIEESDAEITADSLPRVRGDPSQLRQVFQNLLSNAIEYSGPEPPRIHLEAERKGDRWRVSVTDEGIGIDPEDADRVFEIFQRLHGREEHDGTGIGLALCQRIVERHGGEIRVESEPGEGSTFSVTLPAADD
ncbi:PAS domain S-box protein [Haloterrigena turkmenica]|nr:PAS domain S-box protein [Haloterrigena turkmenica]